MIYIYVLVDPRTDDIRYVGKTTDINKRLTSHLCDKSKTHRVFWIKQLLALGLRPLVEVVEVLDDSADWQSREKIWIRLIKNLGYNLTNGTEGGDGVPKLDPSVRERIRLASVGRVHSEEEKAKRIKSCTGQKRSEEFKQLLRAKFKGRKVSDEHRLKAIQARNTALTDQQALDILNLKNRGLSAVAVATLVDFEISPSMVRRIWNGIRYKHIGTLVKTVYDFRQRKLVLYTNTTKMITPNWLTSRA
jgi:hypothetical protein